MIGERMSPRSGPVFSVTPALLGAKYTAGGTPRQIGARTLIFHVYTRSRKYTRVQRVKDLSLTLEDSRQRVQRIVPVTDLVIAGWTGRDREQVEAHIEELAAIGVPRPKAVPTFYRVSADLLTIADVVQVVGSDSTGEAEAVLLAYDAKLWVGVGSDHTDRVLEAVSIAAAKQACPKPMGRHLWAYDEVKNHWDRLVLRSFIVSDTGRELYQEGSLAANTPACELQRKYNGAAQLTDKTAMFCGTLPVHGAFRSGKSFDIELEDPVLGRSLRHSYRLTLLPAAS